MARGFSTTFGVGTTDLVQTRSIPILADKVSVCLWYYLFGAGGNSLGRLVNRAGFDIVYDDGGGIMYFARGNSGGTATAHVTWPTTKDQVWHCLTLTHDQSGGLATPNVWRDGVARTLTNSAQAAGTDAAAVLTIGNAGAGTRVFDGMLAYFTLWVGTLLSAGEAISLASGMHPLNIQPEFIASCIPLDGVSRPEMDFANGMGFTSAITGTKLGNREAPVGALTWPWHRWGGVPTATTGITLRRTLGQRIGSRAA